MCEINRVYTAYQHYNIYMGCIFSRAYFVDLNDIICKNIQCHFHCLTQPSSNLSREIE